MKPTEIKRIAFFDECHIKDNTDRGFMNFLSSQDVSYEMTDLECEEVFRIYDAYAPDKNDWEHIAKLAQTLKDLEYIKIKFMTYEGAEAFETETVIP
jgi:endo-1,4-beta-mannosidase